MTCRQRRGDTGVAHSDLPDVLIIILDAARAENFSLYGYGQNTTPHLSRYADRLAVYRHGISAAMWTLPSTTGLFTGLYPSEHRLVIDGDRLSPAYRTLPEVMKAAGYATAKVTGQVPYVSDFSGLHRGFDHEYEPPPNLTQRLWRSYKRRKTAAAGADRQEGLDLGLDLAAEARMHANGGRKRRLQYWMTGYFDSGAKSCFAETQRLFGQTDPKSGRPLFCYMHLQETHAEYRPPHRYRTCFVPQELRSRNFATINQRPNPHDVGAVTMTEDEYRILTGLYDGCIAYLDEQIGRLLDQLAAQDPERFENMFVLIAADHGDCIGRHGILGHQFVCYDELIHIPWIVKWPASVGITGAVDGLVQNVDVMPTLTELLDLPPVADQGREACSFLGSPTRDLAYSEMLKPFGASAVKQGLHEKAPQYRRAVLSVRSRTHKLLVYSNEQPSEFYNVANDPHETVNLLDSALGGGLVEQATAADCEAFMALKAAAEARKARWLEAAQEVDNRVFHGEAVEIDPEVEQRLRALGYID
ncbi:MAG: sulfatase-like hydrolase/transferase [Planctomycetes bacterium]|nr:sulfatase-like hydrolase/transferase [Planctomycetota bacterium]